MVLGIKKMLALVLPQRPQLLSLSFGEAEFVMQGGGENAGDHTQLHPGRHFIEFPVRSTLLHMYMFSTIDLPACTISPYTKL